MKNIDQIKKEIEASAKEINVSPIEIISTMQSLLVEKGDEKGIMKLHTLKMQYAKKDGLI